MKPVDGRVVRCAIYTRVSTDAGLDQEFNSLDAQYDASQAYIRSQAHAGWTVFGTRYDDGGFSGGSTDRPALQQLLADVAARQVHIIVVYKVDRLTRSLADFAKLVELFDAHGVSFVSVTQQFNTTTSMGRLTLNVLLSFAQFEREVTSERIRDKVAASKRKGLWVGGTVPLGYQLNDGKLTIHEAEAETVRLIFRRYLEIGTVNRLVKDLSTRGLVSKVRHLSTGKTSGGVAFTQGPLFYMLRNRFYVGEVSFKGEILPGPQPPLVDRHLFDTVQAKLTAQWAHRTTARFKSQALLSGLLFDDAGHRMISTHATKNRVRYRYYVSAPCVRGPTDEVVGSVTRVPAQEIELAITEALIADAGASVSSPEGAILSRDVLEAIVVRIEVRKKQLGHGTDRAVALGLLGHDSQSIDIEQIDTVLDRLAAGRRLSGPAAGISFDPATDILFDYGRPLTGHVNGMAFRAYGSGSADPLLTRIYYSVGGGFILSEDDLCGSQQTTSASGDVPFPFDSADTMLRMGSTSGLTIVEMKRANEASAAPGVALDKGLDAIWQVMNACIGRGLRSPGILPGGLKVRRRAPAIYSQMSDPNLRNVGDHSLRAMEWLNVFAMAVNEENAAGGRVVTAPTNGAAGVIPAVIRYYLDHTSGADREGVRTFLLVASAIGGLIKHTASISGAEVGCQGEIGSASAMAAAGLAAALGATNAQVENAAEIALEHHLGMTCDPIGGLVQIPCIERNGFGAVKAVNSVMLAMRGDGSHVVSLDNCIRTMRDTGRDMSSKYKETSLGGLAVNVVEC